MKEVAAAGLSCVAYGSTLGNGATGNLGGLELL